jgi:hypothetical protein
VANISFYTTNGVSQAINNLSGSGLGFYGSTFGNSVAVGSYQQTTFVTNSAGTTQGVQAANVRFAAPSSGIVGSSTTGIPLTAIPNFQSTLNIRFDHSSAVQVQNGIIKIYDRVNVNSAASGVTTKLAEIIHVDPVQNNNGSGDTSWVTFSGIAAAGGQTLSLAPSPGASGFWAGNGSNSVRPDAVHDWYLAISVSPDSISSKLFSLFMSVEYL